MNTWDSEMIFHLWPSVGQMCNTFLTAIPKAVSNPPSCCSSSNQPVSRPCCWQQSYCMFGLIALHPWYNPSLMCAHILLGSLGKDPEVYTSKQWGRWQLQHWKEKVMQTGKMCGKLGHWSYWRRNDGLSTYFRSMWVDFIKKLQHSPFNHCDNTNTPPTAPII